MTTQHLSHIKNEKCGLKKYVKVVTKSKIKNNQMKNLLMKCIETFMIYILLFLKVLNDMIVVNVYP
jgi:hypothetical protein